MGETRHEINRGPLEHHGKWLESVVTDELLDLRNRIGGHTDPMPKAAQPGRTICDECSHEHLTFACEIPGYDDGREWRVCFGCLNRLIHQARLLEPSRIEPAVAGVCEEPAK